MRDKAHKKYPGCLWLIYVYFVWYVCVDLLMFVVSFPLKVFFQPTAFSAPIYEYCEYEITTFNLSLFLCWVRRKIYQVLFHVKIVRIVASTCLRMISYEISICPTGMSCSRRLTENAKIELYSTYHTWKIKYELRVLVSYCMYVVTAGRLRII